ncbi:MAG: SDR family NAD(P)-dependent oxidoreductase [Dehalococcoidia bacterium]
MSLTDKVCIITGGGRGLGRAMAVAYAANGAKAVAITYRSGKELAEATGRDIEEAGAKAHVIPMEVTDRESIKGAYDSVLRAHGSIDVLVNNAGINKQGPVDTVTEADWDDVLAVNLKGPFLCSQEVLPIMMRQGGGRIINMASVSGLYGGPTTAHYAASKAGLISLTQVLARYGAEHNILMLCSHERRAPKVPPLI